MVAITYQKPPGATASPESVKDVVAWCDREGLNASRIPADQLFVIDLGSDRHIAVYREFELDEDGHRSLIGEVGDRDRHAYRKTGWQLREVDTTPAPFVAL